MDVSSDTGRHAATMRLRAVRSGGEVIDFVWDAASDAAAALLRCSPALLPGKYLCAWQDAGPPDQPRLIHRYRRILERGLTQSFGHMHQVDGRHDVVIHRVVLEGDGVVVTLTNLSANQRAQALRLRCDHVPAGRRPAQR
jgi:hypothetical protein